MFSLGEQLNRDYLIIFCVANYYQYKNQVKNPKLFVKSFRYETQDAINCTLENGQLKFRGALAFGQEIYGNALQSRHFPGVVLCGRMYP